MIKLSDTQSRILNAASRRAGNLAMPLPKGLHGAVAKKLVGMMIERGLLEEVDVNTKNMSRSGVKSVVSMAPRW